jgi:hypothetical protein
VSSVSPVFSLVVTVLLLEVLLFVLLECIIVVYAGLALLLINDRSN